MGKANFSQCGPNKSATEESDCIAVDVGEGGVGVAEQPRHNRSAGDTGDYVDIIEEFEIFECAQSAKMKRHSP